VSTGTNGTYLVSNLGAGRYTVTADAEGYLEESVELTLAEGEDRTGVNFALSPGADGDITGQVSDSRTGRPIGGVLIQLFDQEGTLVREVTSNEAGVFSLLGIPTGSYELRASAEGYLPFTTTVELSEGEDLHIPISLRAVSPVPPFGGTAQFYIITGGSALTLDSASSPTLFTLESIDSDRNCATFSYEAVVEGSTIRRLVTFDLTCINLIRVSS
jgi:5-hydroxyisourate hydrolase-like protein (transthyretin family)